MKKARLGWILAASVGATAWACNDDDTSSIEPGADASTTSSSSGTPGSSSGNGSSTSGSTSSSSGTIDDGGSSGGSSSGSSNGGPADTAPSLGVGFQYACVLRSDHTVWCWGQNESYRLGNGEDSRGVFATPAAVRAPDGNGSLQDVVALATGHSHACALRADGTVWCWGDNTWGKLGDGTQDTSGLPVQVQRAAGGALSDVRAIFAGPDNSCAIVGDEREAHCWGWNGDGQLGIGRGDDVPGVSLGATPMLNYDGTARMGDVRGIGIGTGYICVASERIWSGYSEEIGMGAVWCVGRHNALLQLGDGMPAATARTHFPVAVRTPQGNAWLSGISTVQAGDAHTCVRWRGGAHVTCWGSDTVGQRGMLGDPFIPQDGGPPSAARPNVAPLVGQLLAEGAAGERDINPRELALSFGTTCVVVDVVDNENPAVELGRGEVRCMGADYQGGLGDGTTSTGYRSSFGKVVAVGEAGGSLQHVRKLAAGGGSNTCALLDDGTVACWGPFQGVLMGPHAGPFVDVQAPTLVLDAQGAPFVFD